MLRVATIIQQYDSAQGGAVSAFNSILSALLAQQERVALTAICPRPPAGDASYEQIEAMSQVAWRFTGPVGRLGPGAFGEEVAAEIGAGAFDLLHIQGVWSPDLVLAAKACRDAGIPYVWMAHGMLMDPALAQKRLKKRVFMALGLARALRGASSHWWGSAGERDTSTLPRGVDWENNSFLAGLPVDVPTSDESIPTLASEGRARFGFDAADDVVAFVGRLHPVKRVEFTIEALARLRKHRPRARLLVMGKGDAEYTRLLHDTAARHGVTDDVRFAGWVSDEDKWRGLATADVLAVNSIHESYSYALIEALGAGTPGVLTENLCIREDVSPTDAVIVVPESADALARGLEQVLADPSRLELGLRGRAWVLQTYSREALGKRYLENFERLCGRS